MTTGQADIVSIAADTLQTSGEGGAFSLGRIIPLVSDQELHGGESITVTALKTEYAPALKRFEGENRPGETVDTDMAFILLSVSLLIVIIISVFGRKSLVSSLSSISFRRHDEVAPNPTSEVFSWQPLLRNLFTIINISLFATIALLTTGVADSGLFGGSAGLTAILAGSFFAALIARHFTSILVAAVTGLNKPFREYMNVIYSSWFACSVFLFILSVIILYAPVSNTLPMVFTGLVFTSIFLLIRALRLLLIFHERHISIFYFLLYLCALEVLPVLVILKIVGIL